VIPGKQYTPEVALQIAWRLKWWILIPSILVAAGVAAWTRSLQDVYRSDTLIMVVPQRVPESVVRSSQTATLADRLQSITQQILSRSRLEKIIEDLNLYANARKTGIMEDIVDGMRDDIGVEPVKGDAFRVSFSSQDPRTAMRVTERLASLFIDESLRDREVLAEGTNQFLESQLEDSRRQLVDVEKRLEDYRRRHDGQLPNQLEANLQGVHNTEMQVQSLVDSLNRDKDRHLVLERAIADASAAESVAPTPAPTTTGPQTAAQQLAAAQDSLQALLLRLKPGHPDVLRLKRTIAELQQRADAEAAEAPVSIETAPGLSPEAIRQSRIQDAKAELAALDKQIAAKTQNEKELRDNIAVYQRRIEATPTSESELTDLTRDYGTFQQTYTSLLAKKQDTQIAANLERRQIGEQFRILDPARLPTRPATPNRPRYYTFGIVAGIGLGLTLAGLLEYFDRRMRSETDVRAALNVPVLAMIPLIQTSAVKSRRRSPKKTDVAAALILLATDLAARLLS
jgi:polysaccharide chain length determinant protein (PEP-CTERM system associated)